jgi:hypothetical protein
MEAPSGQDFYSVHVDRKRVTMIVMNSKEHYSLAQEESDNDCDDQQRGL